MIELRFLPSRAKTVPLAIRLARDLASSSLPEPASATESSPEGVRVPVPLTPGSLALLSELWGLTGAWPGTRLLLDGHPLAGTPPWRVGAWLRCLARAAAFDPPGRYCRSGPVPPDVPLPWLPCRLWAASWPLWTHRIDWDDPERCEDQLRAALADLGLLHCPFLHWPAFRGILGQRPVDRLLGEIFPRAGETETP